ncbi:alpha-2-macroglobulin-like [Acanthochromis polyacanthus]|uniref:alpha-2-macroglobulin-like n=1 Tax=Acanthochromis polyacanthus TaxID=80966 RepID=UPI002234195C|nr:alpha-2-macroglobulin-like [Acanthochromis polyacanthus]
MGQMWTWTLFVCLSWMQAEPTLAEPKYMVVIPAVLEAGAETKFCASLLQPNETLIMTVTLMSKQTNTTLLEKTSNAEFHTCVQFQVPLVQNEETHKFEVEVRGDKFYSEKVKDVLIKAYKPMTFIQTDKPIYLPGQTVHFRVIALDTKFRPAHQLYTVIEIEDAKGNRIGQWLNKTSAGKILQLSHSLNSEAHEGLYEVIVKTDAKTTQHSFKVKKYVLPKFDVKIKAFDEISIAQSEITADVCATYTYGQPVPGNVELTKCDYGRTINWMSEPSCQSKTMQTNKNGCATFTFKISSFKHLLQSFGYGRHMGEEKLIFRAKVTEEGTGISRSQEKATKISPVVTKLSFIDTPKTYKPGSTVEVKVKVAHYNDTPIPDKVVYLLYGESQQSITTDSDGVAAFSLNTTNLSGTIKLKAQLKPKLRSWFRQHDDVVARTVIRSTSSSHVEAVNSLEVKKKDEKLRCHIKETIFIKYTILGQGEDSVDVMHLVLSRGAIVMQGSKKVDLQNQRVNRGQVSFHLTVSPEMAPDIQVVAYAVLPGGKVFQHSADFSTEKCFSHKVSLEFSPPSAVPGEDINMQVTAQPDSLCGVSVVDQSVLIQEPGKTLDATKIFDLLPVKKMSRVPDAEICFSSLGLRMATNLLPSCGHPQLVRREYSGIVYLPRSTRPMLLHTLRMPPSRVSTAAPVVTVRTFFPETWIWDLVEIGSSGTKDVSLTVPDTITTWETETFCLSPQGFGLAPRKQITVFQPFFLELTLPYSIIRGEQFELKATVFNYLSSCIMVTVTPSPSLDYTLTPISGNQYTSCLCGNERKTFSWTMNPTALGVVNVSVRAEAVTSHVLCDNEIVSIPDRGRIDVVTRSLIVKAEGTEVTTTHNWLFCPKGDSLTEEVELRLPEKVVDGSVRVSLSVLGDILGRALKNIDGLLRMPFGCGEQNMVLLVPNIYILQYLENTQQLTPAIREKASNFMTSGYQRQLNYKHHDGAYSTFGSGPGITWLTAFVLRSFVRAQSFIYIDPTTIEQSKTWLIGKQQQNGCFQQSGKLWDNRMKGGVSDEVTLSAYITAAFLEMNMSVSHPVVEKSLSCLKESLSDLSNTYTTALMAYVFTLAGDTETRGLLLDHLDKVAIKQGGFLHWSQRAAETSASLSVEISSYVLMAKLSASPTNEDLGYASGIIMWLTTQQNYYGGFSSTQDTVVALQALALYATLAFSPQGSSTVKVQSPSGQLTFNVNQDNRLLYQERILQDVTGKFSLEVEGTACASVQVSLDYNIPTPTDVTSLSVKVKPETNCTSQSHRPKLTLKLKSLYSGEENSTNMVILDIKALSGFVPDPESLKQLKNAMLVDRVEQKEDHVLAYLRELSTGTDINHTLEFIQELPVQNLKPAVVKIYDYYQPSDQAETEYIYSCVAA